MPEKRNETSDAAERAAALQKEIERLKGGNAPGLSKSDQPESADQKRPLSPREFIKKRMAELDKKKSE
jgi:hypothetical protein